MRAWLGGQQIVAEVSLDGEDKLSGELLKGLVPWMTTCMPACAATFKGIPASEQACIRVRTYICTSTCTPTHTCPSSLATVMILTNAVLQSRKPPRKTPQSLHLTCPILSYAQTGATDLHDVLYDIQQYHPHHPLAHPSLPRPPAQTGTQAARHTYARTSHRSRAASARRPSSPGCCRWCRRRGGRPHPPTAWASPGRPCWAMHASAAQPWRASFVSCPAASCPKGSTAPAWVRQWAWVGGRGDGDGGCVRTGRDTCWLACEARSEESLSRGESLQ